MNPTSPMPASTLGPAFWELEVRWRDPSLDPRREECLAQIAHLSSGAADLDVAVADVYYLRGGQLGADEITSLSNALLVDPVTQTISVKEPTEGPANEGPASDAGAVATVLHRPGVMDPVEASFLQGLHDLGLEGIEVRTAVRYLFLRPIDPDLRRRVAEKVLANPVIEDVFWLGETQPAPFRGAASYTFEYREVPLSGRTDRQLEELSSGLGLSLQLREMQTIRDHFEKLGRAPADVELETIAQTWSEHCCHKTLTGTVNHVSRARPDGETIENLLKQTIKRATETIAAPWCLSLFEDNAGVIAFDDEYGVSFKVETHNHPSAIEPYGGAGTRALAA